ncbi:MAG: 2-oxoglutarate dehydrogenase, E2 component, dihydrolipoamide succinyltransferase [Vulcanimicrobiaceae bacterium]
MTTANRIPTAVVDVVVPQLGESVDRATIERWLKRAGDRVALDEPLFEITSDKATMEIPALADGVVLEILANEGDDVMVGAVIARIGDRTIGADGGGASAREALPAGARLSPVVRRLLREHSLDAASIHGSASGRITKDDVLASVARLRSATPAPAAPVPAPVPAAPVPAAPAEPPPAASQQPRPVGAVREGRSQPLSRSRLRTIERLTAAKKNAVEVFTVVEVDMEAVAIERKRRAYTYLPFIARATVDALRFHEALNASIDEESSSLVFHDAVNLGFAVDLDDGGLAVPVARNAERLTLDGLASEFARLARGAREAQLPPSEFGGSTFTISNNGSFGTLMTAPAINPPNVAVISTDVVELRPVVVDRMIAIRHRMYLCMTWDHRAFDGSTAAQFLNCIKRSLETWDWKGR